MLFNLQIYFKKESLIFKHVFICLPDNKLISKQVVTYHTGNLVLVTAL